MSTQLPTWDLNQYFPSLHSEEFRAEMQSVKDAIAESVVTMETLSGDIDNDPATFVANYLERSRDLTERIVRLHWRPRFGEHPRCRSPQGDE